MMRMHVAIRGALPIAVLLAYGGAGAARTDDDGVTSVTLIDSVAVTETQSAFVGRPNAIAVDAAGRVYISDASETTVLRVERIGSVLTPDHAKRSWTR